MTGDGPHRTIASRRDGAGIDLRGANLSASHWDGASLRGAHLQCANLVVTQTQDGPRADGTDCLLYEPYHRMPEEAAR